MDKKLFIEAIEAIQKQEDFDNEANKCLNLIFPSGSQSIIFTNNHWLKNALIHILQVEMDDLELCEYGMSWIEYFLWELDFGKKNDRLTVTDHGKEVSMSNASELYDFLTNR